MNAAPGHCGGKKHAWWDRIGTFGYPRFERERRTTQNEEDVCICMNIHPAFMFVITGWIIHVHLQKLVPGILNYAEWWRVLMTGIGPRLTLKHTGTQTLRLQPPTRKREEGETHMKQGFLFLEGCFNSLTVFWIRDVVTVSTRRDQTKTLCMQSVI